MPYIRKNKKKAIFNKTSITIYKWSGKINLEDIMKLSMLAHTYNFKINRIPKIGK